MTTKTTIDHLITASWVVPVIPEKTIYSDYAIAVHNGRIAGLTPIAEAEELYTYHHRTNLPNQAIIPGLINAHGHASMSLLRGFADDHPLQTWLQDYIWPVEGKWVSEEFVHDGTELAMGEMLLSGTTCFHDMYFFPEKVGRLAERVGTRSFITPNIFDLPCAWGSGPDDYLQKTQQTIDEFKGSELVKIGIGPHAPYTVSDPVLEKVIAKAADNDLIIQMHVHETQGEVVDAIRDHGQRPLKRLANLGMLNDRFQLVHMTALNADDFQLLEGSGSHVVHCPESNLKLASGFCPVQKLMDAGVNVALGTDGAASNNDLNLLSEAQTAALLAKAVAGDATAVSAHKALAMATINGAKAMGLEQETGSLEPGKSADLVAIDLSGLPFQPLYEPVSQIIYTGGSHQVSHVWIRGKCQVKNRQLQTLDTEKLMNTARRWKGKISLSA
ncbi:TRZ/ATZ family hydrolase [Candidatus Sororendozoicomonas aggregata]|uniref:TRZ/ATZ family hydrolase n=1 Tax=Candidatus Sororendozoicomonas aggregata TaxID=3073239 RepID=UPI002ED0F28E